MTDELLAEIESGDIGDALPTPLGAKEIDALVAAAKDDPGAPFETETLARIAATKRAELAAFMRLRSRLKDAKVSVSELDRALNDHEAADREDTAGQGRAIEFPEIELWPQPVNGAELLDEIVAAYQRHLVVHEMGVSALALWSVFTHCYADFDHSPRLGLRSPEPRCGKTTVVKITEKLVPRQLRADNVTSSALFRVIERHSPTLLVDEADAFAKENEELRGIINCGHERGGGVIRNVGDEHEPRRFKTWGRC